MRDFEIEALCIGMQIRKPTLSWGDPGIGKSSIWDAIFAALGLPLETVIASIHEPSDFSGLPVADNEERTVWMATPQWCKNAMGWTETGLSGLTGGIFFDEISTAPPAVQAALLRVILGGVVGNSHIPKSVAMIAAANPPETSAGGWEMTAPLANRFIHLHMKASTDTFCDGMVAGWPLPKVRPLNEGWEKQQISTRASVASFIKLRPALLFQFPETSGGAGGPWPSPRTWEYLSIVEAACRNHASEEAEAILMAGCVGDGPALEYATWRRELDLPDPEMLLKNPGKCKLTGRGDKDYAILTSVVAAVLGNNTGDRWCAAWDVLSTAVKSGQPDVAAGSARALAMNQPDGVEAPASAAAFGALLIRSGLV